MERKYLEILKGLEDDIKRDEITPVSAQESKLIESLMDQNLIDGVICYRNESWATYENVKLTHSGRRYLAELVERHPPVWKVALKYVYLVVTFGAAIFVGFVALVADLKTILS